MELGNSAFTQQILIKHYKRLTHMLCLQQFQTRQRQPVLHCQDWMGYQPPSALVRYLLCLIIHFLA